MTSVKQTVALRTLISVLIVMVSYAIARHVPLPYVRPDGIEPPAGVSASWNPESNFFEIVFMAAITVVIYVFLTRLLLWKEWLWRVVVACMVLVLIAIPLLSDAVHSPIDQFHAGEQLAPARAFLNGAKPYTDIFVIHGLGEDVLRPAIGVLLFNGGELSVGSYVLIVAFARIVSTALLLTFLCLLVKRREILVSVFIFLICTSFLGFSYARLIIVYLVLISMLLSYRASSRWISISFASLLGVFASCAWFDSLDSAVMCAAFLGIFTLGAVVKAIVKWRDESTSWTLVFPAISGAIAALAGFVLVQFLAFCTLGYQGYFAFVRTSLSEIPRYQSAFSNLPIDGLSRETTYLWFPALAAVAVLLLLVIGWAYRRSLGFDERLVLVVLVAAMLISLRLSYGRADEAHTGEWGTFVIIALAYVVDCALRSSARDFGRTAVTFASMIAVLALLSPPALQLERGFAAGNTNVREVGRLVRDLPVRPTAAWMTPNMIGLVSELDARLSTDDRIFVFTNDPALYYFSARPNATEFFVSWFADPPELTRRMLDELEANPPAAVVVDGPLGVIDGLTSAQRLPEVAEWLNERYPVREVIAGYTVAFLSGR